MKTTPHIDLEADLNLEGDHGRNLARVEDAVDPGLLRVGNYLTVGRPWAWSWACVEAIEGEGV